jgi:nucleoid-associated protein YgaU
MRAKIYRSLAIAFISGTFLSGCDVVLPIKEMADAKTAISTAERYKASVYAPEELKAAGDALLAAHEAIKNAKDKDAQAKALDAKAKADAAIAKALPLLAKDTIDGAKKTIAEAKGLFSDEFAPEETIAAENAINEADALYGAKSFAEAYEDGLSAQSSANAARDKALARIPALKSKLAELESERDTLKSHDAASYAGEELSELDADLEAAHIALNENRIQEAVVSIGNASDRIEKIHFMGKGMLAQQKIAKAEESLAKISASPGADKAKDDIEKARAKTGEAKQTLSDGNPDDALTRADEALAMIDAIAISLEKNKTGGSTASNGATITTDKKNGVIVTGDEVRYTVQWRKRNTDCLWRIAGKMYKNAKMWPIIFMANRDQIKDPDLIYPGQKLIIPALKKKKAAWDMDKPEPIPSGTKEDEGAAVVTKETEGTSGEAGEGEETAPDKNTGEGEAVPAEEPTEKSADETTDETGEGSSGDSAVSDDAGNTSTDNGVTEDSAKTTDKPADEETAPVVEKADDKADDAAKKTDGDAASDKATDKPADGKTAPADEKADDKTGGAAKKTDGGTVSGNKTDKSVDGKKAAGSKATAKKNSSTLAKGDKKTPGDKKTAGGTGVSSDAIESKKIAGGDLLENPLLEKGTSAESEEEINP